MAKKNLDILLSNIMGQTVISQAEEETKPVAQTAPSADPSPTQDKNGSKEVPWKHFTFICSVELADKVQAIAHKEGFTIRALMEYLMSQGVANYESKHGKVRKIKTKEVTDVL